MNRQTTSVFVRVSSVFMLVTAFTLAVTWAVSANGVAPRSIGPHALTSIAPLTLNLNLGSEPPTLDPALATDSTSANVIRQLFIGLVDVDDTTAEVKPALATSWLVSPNGTVYTFTLRPDVKWSDGNSVTAQDVRYGILRTLAPATAAGYAYVLTPIIKNAVGYHAGTLTDTNQVGAFVIGDQIFEDSAHASSF